jgi:hypothetical protein
LLKRHPQNSKKALNLTTLLILVVSALVLGLIIIPNVNAALSVTLNPTSGPPGTVVQVTCSGYTPNGQVQATVNGTVLGTKTADSNGDLNFNVTVPNFPAGTYKFISTDLTTQTQTQVQFTETSTTTTASPTPTVPEFPSLAIAIAAMVLTAGAFLTAKKRGTSKN